MESAVALGADWCISRRAGQDYLCCVPLLDLPWLRHAFSLRADATGHSQNMALHAGGGEAGAVRANRERFLSGLALPLTSLVAGEQVHGTRVTTVGPAEQGAGSIDYATALPGTDGLATKTPGLALSVYYADCAPILLVDPVARAVAAVHAGWRGAVAGIVAEALAVMRKELFVDPARVLAAVGPTIGPCCYEVGAELAAQVPPEARAEVLRGQAEGRHYLDLPGMNSWWLQRAGVPGGNVFSSGQCTGCHPNRFYSHRRQGGAAGRMMAVIARVA